MKCLTCGPGVLVVALALGGVPGCGTDNESDANQPSADLKAPGDYKKADAPPVPTSMEDYIKNQKSANAASSAVPGAPKTKTSP